jgi:uncharacterized Zn finger protein
MIEINETNIQRAIAKARQTKPLVRVIEFRTYQVTNRMTGKTYTVKFSKVHNRKYAECDCAAGQAGKFLCHHVAASVGIHLLLAMQTVNA